MTVVNALVLGFAVALTIKAVVEDKFKALQSGSLLRPSLGWFCSYSRRSHRIENRLCKGCRH